MRHVGHSLLFVVLVLGSCARAYAQQPSRSADTAVFQERPFFLLGGEYMASELDALVDTLHAYGLPGRSGPNAGVRLGGGFGWRRYAVILGWTTNSYTTDADTASARTRRWSWGALFAYEAVRAGRWHAYPLLGFRSTYISYSYVGPPHGGGFGTVVQRRGAAFGLEHQLHSAEIGAKVSWGKGLRIALQGTALIPLASDTWKEAGTGARITGGPSVRHPWAVGLTMELPLSDPGPRKASRRE